MKYENYKEYMPQELKMRQFHKVLAKYYIKWFHDCHESAIYCKRCGRYTEAQQYLDDARDYLNIIMDNWEAIEFFSIKDNAHKIDSALPEKFRGYK